MPKYRVPSGRTAEVAVPALTVLRMSHRCRKGHCKRRRTQDCNRSCCRRARYTTERSTDLHIQRTARNHPRPYRATPRNNNRRRPRRISNWNCNSSDFAIHSDGLQKRSK